MVYLRCALGKPVHRATMYNDIRLVSYWHPGCVEPIFRAKLDCHLSGEPVLECSLVSTSLTPHEMTRKVSLCKGEKGWGQTWCRRIMSISGEYFFAWQRQKSRNREKGPKKTHESTQFAHLPETFHLCWHHHWNTWKNPGLRHLRLNTSLGAASISVRRSTDSEVLPWEKSSKLTSQRKIETDLKKVSIILKIKVETDLLKEMISGWKGSHKRRGWQKWCKSVNIISHQTFGWILDRTWLKVRARCGYGKLIEMPRMMMYASTAGKEWPWHAMRNPFTIHPSIHPSIHPFVPFRSVPFDSIPCHLILSHLISFHFISFIICFFFIFFILIFINSQFPLISPADAVAVQAMAGSWCWMERAYGHHLVPAGRASIHYPAFCHSTSQILDFSLFQFEV